ncbi:MAG: cytochrome c [Gemmatimonadota bacterium]|nr:cytochrome c [Gemmatimonadota bacterium]MDH5758920.1 cytochrome c [Gemmatimonadota bacterium]
MISFLHRTALLPLVFVLACGGDDASQASQPAQASGTAASQPAVGSDLTATELEQGLGPVRDMVLGEIDPALAEEGSAAFVTRCSACHKMEDRYVGPELGTVLSRRRPEFVMNMILNATEMVERHPAVRELLAQFYTPMPVQVTDQAEARAILEYLRASQIEVEAATEAGDPTS